MGTRRRGYRGGTASAFAQALARGVSASAAYGQVGFKPHRANAATLARKEHISVRVAELQEEQLAIHKQATAEAVANAKVTRCWFNDFTTEAGRDALGYYHERQDEKRSIGLGPEHDWSSHAADAFGYMAIAYEEPPASFRRIRRPPPPRIGTHWSD